MSKTGKYQRHVDGLRAVAVLSVVFYHFGYAAFGGGYIGVDVFFVISGYLITRVILDEIKGAGGFQFKRFYIRRMRRLFPAMLATFSSSLIVAAVLFSPEQFQKFGGSLSAAIFSVSNIFFWTESGYFDVNAHLKPLLHTWSLSVEEQFYLFWPALLWFITLKSNRQLLPLIFIMLGIASLAINYIWVLGNFDVDFSSTIFYLTPFRVFEFTIGALAIFAAPLIASKRLFQELGMSAGLLLIGYSTFAFSDKLIFPYYYALVPCLGAFFVIISKESRFIGQVLTNPVSVGIGLISYSLYLVHWPVLIFYEYYSFEPITGIEKITLLAVVASLATLMYFFVEKPFRKNAPTRTNPAPQKSFVLASLSVMAVSGLIGIQIGASSGWSWRQPNALTATTVNEGKKRRFEFTSKGCNLTRLDDPTYCDVNKSQQILVIGNSHEPDGYNAFTTVYKNNPAVNLISFGTFNRCDVQFNDSGPFSKINDRDCAQRVALLNDEVFISSLDGLIYSANIPFAKNQRMTWRILRYLKSINTNFQVVVLGGYINTRRECSELYNRFYSFNACKDPRFISYSPFNEQNNSQIKEDNEIDYLYIDKTRLLCSGGGLESCQVEAHGEPAFYDRHHLSLGFASYLGERIADVYGEALIKAGFPAPTPLVQSARKTPE